MQYIFIFFPLILAIFYSSIDIFKLKFKYINQISYLTFFWAVFGFVFFYYQINTTTVLDSLVLINTQTQAGPSIQELQHQHYSQMKFHHNMKVCEKIIKIDCKVCKDVQQNKTQFYCDNQYKKLQYIQLTQITNKNLFQNINKLPQNIDISQPCQDNQKQESDLTEKTIENENKEKPKDSNIIKEKVKEITNDSSSFTPFGDFGFLFDNISIACIHLISLVTCFCMLFARGYLTYDPHCFLARLYFLSFSLILLVTSKNLLQICISFELISQALYLLSIVKYKKQASIAPFSLRGFLISKLGDFLFFITVIGLFILHNAKIIQTYDTYGINIFTAITFLISLCIKSYQFFAINGFKGAMYSPSPSAPIINMLGFVYLIVFTRILYLVNMDCIFNLFIIIGIISAIYGFVAASNATFIKDVITYSTSAELGIVLIAVGYKLYNVLPIYLFTHTICKTLFCFCVCSVINALSGEKNLHQMGGLFQLMPRTYITFLISILSLIGMPLLPAFYSKGTVLMYGLQYSSIFCAPFYILIFFLNMLYPFKILYLIFHDESKINEKVLGYVNENNKYIMFTIYFVLGFTLLSGFFFNYAIYDIFMFDLSLQFYFQKINILFLVCIQVFFMLLILFLIKKGFINLNFNSNFYKIDVFTKIKAKIDFYKIFHKTYYNFYKLMFKIDKKFKGLFNQ